MLAILAFVGYTGQYHRLPVFGSIFKRPFMAGDRPSSPGSSLAEGTVSFPINCHLAIELKARGDLAC
jgi:hypothetical protein